jgi:hypothetical protein
MAHREDPQSHEVDFFRLEILKRLSPQLKVWSQRRIGSCVEVVTLLSMAQKGLAM